MTNQDLKWRLSIANYVINSIKTEIKKVTEQDAKKKFSVSELLCLISKKLFDAGVSLAVTPEKNWREDENNLDRTFVFNADTLFWEKSIFLFESIMTAIIPAHAVTDVTKLANIVFQECCKLNLQVPTPYSGSRYLLFKNGVYDAKTRQLIDMQPIPYDVNGVKFLSFSTNKLELNGEEVFIPQVGFQPKHLHNIDLDMDAKCPEYTGANGGTWTPDGWLVRTAGSQAKAHFIKQTMGAMLTPNHSFNAFVEINGASNSGKTTLINIISAIYNNNASVLQGYTLDDLNDTFPFRGMVTDETSFVHITETNGAGLKPSAISLINSFANTMLQMKQMGAQSVTLTPPPMLVLEGKGWLLFDSVKTGISRRLLPIDITEANTKGYYSHRYGRRIFDRPKVLAYLAKEIMLAYSELTDGDDNFTYNIDDLNTLPTFAQVWHHNAVNAGDETMNDFFDNVISPALRVGKVPLKLMYMLYEEYVKMSGSEQYCRPFRSFKETMPVYMQTKFNLESIKTGEKIESADDLALDLDIVKGRMPMPEELKRYGQSPFCKYPHTSIVDVRPIVN